MQPARIVGVSSPKSYAKELLKRMHLYERIKGSCVYDLFWRIVDKRIIQERESEVEFYQRFLRGFRKKDLIFDIGANQGLQDGYLSQAGCNSCGSRSRRHESKDPTG